jgi:hypothetical protein
VVLSFFLDIGRAVHFVKIIFMASVRYSVFLCLGNQELLCFARNAFLLRDHQSTVASRLLVYWLYHNALENSSLLSNSM